MACVFAIDLLAEVRAERVYRTIFFLLLFSFVFNLSLATSTARPVVKYKLIFGAEPSVQKP